MRRIALTLLPVLAMAMPGAALAADSSGGAAASGDISPAPAAPLPVVRPVVPRGGRIAAPRHAPRAVRAAVTGGNRLIGKPYLWGGGHASFRARGYDCSGSVSFVLHAAGLLASPLDSTGLSHWGRRGRGRWITVYANRTHAFMVVGGVRLDTSGRPSGPRWRDALRGTRGYAARHPAGL